MELQTCATRWILTLAGREMIPISPFALCSLACLIGIFANLHVRLEAACGAEGKQRGLRSAAKLPGALHLTGASIAARAMSCVLQHVLGVFCRWVQSAQLLFSDRGRHVHTSAASDWIFLSPSCPGACNMVTHLYPEKEVGMRKPPE